MAALILISSLCLVGAIFCIGFLIALCKESRGVLVCHLLRLQSVKGEDTMLKTEGRKRHLVRAA